MGKLKTIFEIIALITVLVIVLSLLISTFIGLYLIADKIAVFLSGGVVNIKTRLMTIAIFVMLWLLFLLLIGTEKSLENKIVDNKSNNEAKNILEKSQKQKIIWNSVNHIIDAWRYKISTNRNITCPVCGQKHLKTRKKINDSDVDAMNKADFIENIVEVIEAIEK